MSDDEGTPPLPRELWVLAGASLTAQLLQLTEGVRSQNLVSLLLSTVLGGLLVGYVSAGVVRARTVRLVLAGVVLGLTVLFGSVALVFSPSPREFVTTLLALAPAVVSLVALLRFRRTPWYAWQRTRPPTSEGATIGRLVAIGVLVGVLGGVVGPGTGQDVDVRVGVEGR